MKMQLDRSAARLRDRLRREGFSSRSMAVRLGALALTIVFTAGQMQAQGPLVRESADMQPATNTQQAQAAPTDQPTSSVLPEAAVSTAVPAAETANAQGVATTGQAALPDAPIAPGESASLTAPVTLKAMMDAQAQAAQAGQNVQPAATKQKQEHHAHPAWLVLTGFGLLCAAIGAGGLDKGSNKPAAAGFLVGGLGLAGLGVYLTIK